MRSKTKFVLIIIATLALLLASSQPALAASDEEEIIQLSQNCAIAMKTADYELMYSLWWHSDKTTAYFPDRPFLLDSEAILDLWQSLCSLPAGTHAPTFHNIQVTMLDDDMAISTFYANHVYTDPTTKEQFSMPFRVTLVVKKISEKWLIAHQHTSKLPTE